MTEPLWTVTTVRQNERDVSVGFAALADPGDVARLADRARGLGPDVVVVVSADLGHRLADVVQVLRPVLREVVCCDGEGTPDGPPPLGTDLSWYALDTLGVGQDFAYTVPDLADGLDLALAQVADAGSGWSGTCVLVLGPAGTVDRVREHVRARSGDDG